MKRLLTVILLSTIWSGVLAQQGGQAFTLDQCIEYALVNSASAQNADIDEQIAGARVKEVRGYGLPQVSAGASVQHNEKLRRFFGRNSTDTTGFSFFPPVEGAKDGDIIAGQNFFQLKSSGDAGITISQLIFSGSYVVGLQAAKALKDYAAKDNRVTKETLVQNVMKSYYAVLITRERVTLFDANIARVDTLLRNTIELNKNGFAEAIDVDRIRVQFNNLKTERANFENQSIIVVELLKAIMNYPMQQPLEVLGKVEDVQFQTDPAAYEEGWDYRRDADFVLLEARHTLQQLNIRNNYAGAVPTLSAFANLGYSTQSNSISGVFKTNTTGVQDNGIVGPDKWYGYSMFGLSLNWDLFTGMSRTYKIHQEKLALRKLENGFRALKSSIDLETKQASLVYSNSLKTLQSEKENMDLANNVARVTKIKYEQGVGSNIEVTNAEGDLRTAQVNYYNALIAAMLAKVDLDKAFGKLVVPPTPETK